MNVLLNMYNFDEDWAKPVLKDIIKPTSRVLIIPLSFHDDEMQGNDDWVHMYSKGKGKWYRDIIRPFLSYGVKESNITWLDYYLDTNSSAKHKMLRSDIIFFTGGLPDKIMERLDEAGLIMAVRQYHGTIIGCSAGALVQFQEYHITPDKDYAGYGYRNGLEFIRDFEIEVHYEGTQEQLSSIRRYKRERNKPIYAMGNKGGIVVDKDKIILMGDVKEV